VVVQETHAGRFVSVRFCLGRTTLRGSPLPTAPRHHLMVYTPPTSMGRSSSWTQVKDSTKLCMLRSVCPTTCVRVHPRYHSPALARTPVPPRLFNKTLFTRHLPLQRLCAVAAQLFAIKSSTSFASSPLLLLSSPPPLSFSPPSSVHPSTTSLPPSLLPPMSPILPPVSCCYQPVAFPPDVSQLLPEFLCLLFLWRL